MKTKKILLFLAILSGPLFAASPTYLGTFIDPSLYSRTYQYEVVRTSAYTGRKYKSFSKEKALIKNNAELTQFCNNYLPLYENKLTPSLNVQIIPDLKNNPIITKLLNTNDSQMIHSENAILLDEKKLNAKNNISNMNTLLETNNITELIWDTIKFDVNTERKGLSFKHLIPIVNIFVKPPKSSTEEVTLYRTRFSYSKENGFQKQEDGCLFKFNRKKIIDPINLTDFNTAKPMLAFLITQDLLKINTP